MLKLFGFPASNYYNVVKAALLEKGVAFEEVAIWPSDVSPSDSPLQKVPYIVTEEGPLCESSVILDYIEARYPEPALMPKDPFAASKAREIIRYSELHLELVARQVYGEILLGTPTAEDLKRKVERQLRRNVAAFARVVKLSPYAAGSEFSLADCALVAHLPMIRLTSKKVWGEDFLAELPVTEYLARMHERPSFARVRTESRANFGVFVDYLKSFQAPAPKA